MPRLEVRLTDRQLELLDAAARAEGMSRSAYVRWLCLREDHGARHQYEEGQRERAIQSRARAAKAAFKPEPPPVVEPPPQPLVSAQTVALQAGVTYMRAQELLEAGRVTFDNGHLKVDDEPV